MLIPRQSLTNNIKHLQVFSVTLGTTTTNYLLIAIQNTIYIYVYHGNLHFLCLLYEPIIVYNHLNISISHQVFQIMNYPV